MFKIGIDLGGTKIEAIILDNSLKEIFRKRINTEQEKGYEHILDNIASLYKECSKVIHEAEHTFGIGTPGSVSAKTGMLKNSNTVCLNGKPFLHGVSIIVYILVCGYNIIRAGAGKNTKRQIRQSNISRMVCRSGRYNF